MARNGDSLGADIREHHHIPKPCPFPLAEYVLWRIIKEIPFEKRPTHLAFHMFVRFCRWIKLKRGVQRGDGDYSIRWRARTAKGNRNSELDPPSTRTTARLETTVECYFISWDSTTSSVQGSALGLEGHCKGHYGDRVLYGNDVDKHPSQS